MLPKNKVVVRTLGNPKFNPRALMALVLVKDLANGKETKSLIAC